ncbi:MAG TPA: hypothetical protein VFK85_15165 [Anaeromyxobacteraceae bacterium]|nr:hypothetical protein [Anaeromyxobacteraceae bacterium]
MEPHESSVVVEAGSEIVQLEQQLESEIVDIEERIARSSAAATLRELASFATAMIVTTAGVLLAGVVGVLFCYAVLVASPLVVVVLLGAAAVAIGRSAQRHRALAS